MDLRGYGGSDKTPRGYDPFTLAGDVAGVIRSLGYSEAVVIGHGWGGMLGWTTAVLEPKVVAALVVLSAAHPRRMRTAVAADPHQLAASKYVLGYQRPWVPERALTDDDAAEVARLLLQWSASERWPDPDTVARYRRAMQIEAVAHCALEYHRWAIRSLFRPDGMRFARRMRTPIARPVLQLHGARDPAILPSSAAGSGQYVAGPYTWTLVPEAGHFPQEEQPEVVNEMLTSWLRTQVTAT